MASTIEIKVPDIGGHGNVPVIEVLVQVGDSVAKEQSLITLESDKATMEIPSSAAGVIRELKLKVGDEVSEGSLIALLETVGTADSASSTAAHGEHGTPSPSPLRGEGRGEGTGLPGTSSEANAASSNPARPRPAPHS